MDGTVCGNVMFGGLANCDVINSVVCFAHPGSTHSDALPPTHTRSFEYPSHHLSVRTD